MENIWSLLEKENGKEKGGNFGGQRRRKITEKEKNENIWRRKIYSLRRRRKTKKAENFWRRKFFCGDEEKRRRYLGKENNFSWRRKKQRRKWGKIFGEEKYIFLRRRRKSKRIFGEGKYIVCKGKEKQRRRKSCGEGKCHDGGPTDRRLSRQTYIVKIELEIWTRNLQFIVDDKADATALVLLLNKYCIKIK